MLAICEEADQIGCCHFQLKIGKTSHSPFFVDSDGVPFIFGGIEIEQSDQFCDTCKEPISNEAEHKATVDIRTCEILEGELPKKQKKLVLAWAELHQEELMANWTLVMNGEEPFKINPLQ